MKVTVETGVNAPVAKVRDAYVTPEDIVQWNAASDDWHTTKSTVDLRTGWQAILDNFTRHNKAAC
jgi:uncharacterized protein YndB with AHSA1/START domain